MKKFWNLMLAALVIFGAVACTEKEVAPEQNAGMSIYATINAEQTRVDVVQDENYDTNKKWNTIWTAGDTLEVHSLEDNTFFYFENSADNVNKFTCNEPGVNDLIGDNVLVSVVTNTENCSTSYNSTKGKQGAEINVEIENFDPANTINLETLTAFLRYSSNYEITLEASDDIFYDKDDNNVNTITLPASEDVWVAVGSCQNITFSYTIDGVKCKETTTTFEAGKIYNLGELAEPVKSEYGVVGTFQGWDVAVGKPVAMYTYGDWVVARGIELYKSDEIKIVKGNSWGESYGLDAASVLTTDAEHTLKKNASGNIKVAKNGKFDIYFKANGSAFKYECVEEYTDLKVNITIDNKAGWSPLYIVLKDGENLLTAAEGNLVTGNTYAVSGDYIGSALSYHFISGSKKTEPAYVTITKDGAAVTLEEKVVKFEFKLNTDNSKQWWGDNTYIYVWNSGTSMDNTWPGTKMTNDGNYTWHINIPSDVVGKKINYIIFNGVSWQSPDQKNVLIPETGLVVYGSNIGIN